MVGRNGPVSYSGGRFIGRDGSTARQPVWGPWSLSSWSLGGDSGRTLAKRVDRRPFDSNPVVPDAYRCDPGRSSPGRLSRAHGLSLPASRRTCPDAFDPFSRRRLERTVRGPALRDGWMPRPADAIVPVSRGQRRCSAENPGESPSIWLQSVDPSRARYVRDKSTPKRRVTRCARGRPVFRVTLPAVSGHSPGSTDDFGSLSQVHQEVFEVELDPGGPGRVHAGGVLGRVVGRDSSPTRRWAPGVAGGGRPPGRA